MVHLTKRFDEAVAYATVVHAGQTRKSTGIPYLAHLFGVTALVLENGGDEDQAIGALLHDAAEDSGGTDRLDDIRARFGDRVAEIVDACSDTLETTKPPWPERKERFIARLPEAPGDALPVIAADKLHNARAILRDYLFLGEALWDRFNAGREGQFWYFGSLLPILQERLPGHLTDELAATIGRLREAAGV